MCLSRITIPLAGRALFGWQNIFIAKKDVFFLMKILIFELGSSIKGVKYDNSPLSYYFI